jgi:hypothetical protein
MDKGGNSGKYGSPDFFLNDLISELKSLFQCQYDVLTNMPGVYKIIFRSQLYNIQIDFLYKRKYMTVLVYFKTISNIKSTIYANCPYDVYYIRKNTYEIIKETLINYHKVDSNIINNINEKLAEISNIKKE